VFSYILVFAITLIVVGLAVGANFTTAHRK